MQREYGVGDWMKKQKWKVKFCAGLLVVSMVGSQLLYGITADAANWYSQKGIVYEGKTLTSMCYITSYAMILKNLSFDVTPVDVYVANGKSNYVDHSKLAAYFQITSQSGSLSGLTADKKKEMLLSLLQKHPEGVIVKGIYDGSSTHFIVARKAINGQVYFDDPAFEKEEDGCCIPIEDTWKLTWSNLTEYRVIDKNSNSDTVDNSNNENKENTTSSAIGTEDKKEENKKEENTSEYTVPTRTIYVTTPYMTGSDVKWVQASLKKLGYSCSINGIYNGAAKKAVIKFQGDNGLEKDGYVGPITRKKIIALLAEKELIASGAVKVKVGKVTGVSLKKRTVKKKSKVYSVTYKWKKASNASGYKVMYSTDSKFRTKKVKTISKTSCIISKLKKGKTYYFRTRAYKKVNNKVVYGAYSTVKKVKVKK